MTTSKITRLVPMLSTRDLPATIDFYTNVLGFTLNATYPEGDAPTWCNLSSGDATIMFSTFNADGAELPGSIYLYPDDVDATWERVKDHAEVDAPPSNAEYGMREFIVHDPNGYHLIFGAPIAG